MKPQDLTVPPGQTVTGGFPVLHVGDVPEIDPPAWRLRVFGECESPFELSYPELQAMPPVTWNGDIHCVTRWSKKNTEWRGVRFSAIAERAHPKPGVKYVVQHGENAYSTNLPLAAMMDDDVLIAYEFDGAPVEAIHGGPVRMLVPKRYFWKSAKWLNGIEFLTADKPGFWEVRGYHNEGDPWKEERYSGIPAWFE